MDKALNKYSVDELKEIIEKNKKIEINDENIKKGLTGICALCGEPWDMALHWGTVTGEYDNEEYLIVENKKFGVVHDICNALYEEGEFKDLEEVIEGKKVVEAKVKIKAESPKDKVSEDSEKLPIHESLEIVKAHTFRKSDKWWTAIAAVRSTFAKNPRTVLAFYRWRKNKDGKWKQIKKWTINSKEDWEKFKKIVNEDFADILWQ
ncbi:MAG: hypothetical protein ACTSRP_03925 [Candidatus Helarchaeota archaeon]